MLSSQIKTNSKNDGGKWLIEFSYIMIPYIYCVFVFLISKFQKIIELRKKNSQKMYFYECSRLVPSEKTKIQFPT